MNEKLFVIKIVNADMAPLRFWYRRKGGELFICRYVEKEGVYRTFQSIIPDEEAYGDIILEHAFVVTEFEYNEDSY
jgi:hypothetical protein